MTFYKFAVGVVLAAAMIIVLFLSVVVFSSRDFQYGVAQTASTTSGLVDFSRLEDVGKLSDDLLANSDAPRRELGILQERRTNLVEQSREADRLITEARTSAASSIAQFEPRAGQPAGESPSGASDEQLQTRLQALAQRPELAEAERGRVQTLVSSVQQISEHEAVIASNAEQLRETEQRFLSLSRQVGESDAQIAALQRTVVAPEHFTRIRNEAKALQNLSVLNISAQLAQGHPALLSTFLVLSMGALGSLLYLFPAYLNRPEPVTMAEIFVRLIFGMCAAIAAYVLTNAAISTFQITDTQTQAATSAGLNPFAVSLIGIVAGVLSEDIAKWVQDRGRGVLQITGSTRGNVPGSTAQRADDAAPTGGLVNNTALDG